jgi:hypothetical protein
LCCLLNIRKEIAVYEYLLAQKNVILRKEQ